MGARGDIDYLTGRGGVATQKNKSLSSNGKKYALSERQFKGTKEKHEGDILFLRPASRKGKISPTHRKRARVGTNVSPITIRQRKQFRRTQRDPEKPKRVGGFRPGRAAQMVLDGQDSFLLRRQRRGGRCCYREPL